MIAEAIQKLTELAQAGIDPARLIATVGEHEMSTQALHHIPQKPFAKEPSPPVLSLSSLTSLVTYIQANRDALELDDFVLHVVSPTRVDLLGPLVGEAVERFAYVSATCDDLAHGWIGRHHAQELFVVGLQSRFVQDEETARVLKLVQRIKQEAGVTTEDDGRTQTVQQKSGVHLGAEADVPNPVPLAPYRTFREVDQPASDFVLRVSQDMQLALFEGDGGAWKLKAAERVAEWLKAEGRVTDIPVLS